jgi:hypothetical protein
MTLDSTHLRSVGEALFGHAWPAPLANELDISERTLRRWMAGRMIPEGIWPELIIICQERAVILSDLISHLEKEGTKP